MNRGASVLLGIGLLSASACLGMGRVRTPAPPTNAFGDESFRMIPVPSEDHSILGRVIKEPPDEMSSFEAEARPNPCEEHLETEVVAALEQKIRRAQRLDAAIELQAVLQGYGFSGSSSTDTHLVYDIETQRKVVRRDTPAYAECCRTRDCGHGYISTLVWGTGEYASGRETTVSAEADYRGFVGAAGRVDIAASERKSVKGWVAAVVTPHEVQRNMADNRSKAFIGAGGATLALGMAGLGMMTYGLVRAPQLAADRRERADDPLALSEQIEQANRIAIAGGVVGGVLTATGAALLGVGAFGRQRKQLAIVPTTGPLYGASMELRF